MEHATREFFRLQIERALRRVLARYATAVELREKRIELETRRTEAALRRKKQVEELWKEARKWSFWLGWSILLLAFGGLAGAIGGIQIPEGVVCRQANLPCHWLRWRNLKTIIK